MVVDAELAPAGQAVAQAAMGQAIEGLGAARLGLGHRLQPGLDLEVGLEPGRGHRSRRQSGHAGELDQILIAGLGQHAFEFVAGIALEGHGKRRAQLNACAAQTLDARDVFAAADPARSDQWNPPLQPSLPQKCQRFGDHAIEIEARVVQVGDLGRTQVTASQPGMLDHDGIGQTILAFPFLDDQCHAAGVAEDGHQQCLGMVGRQVGQVQRQPCAHHHHVDASLERALDVGCVVADRAHHVHRDQTTAARSGACGLDLAADSLQVRGIDLQPGVSIAANPRGQTLGAGHQIRMVSAQIHRAERAYPALSCHSASQTMRRHPYAHAPLDDRQQASASQRHRVQPAGSPGGQQ